MCPTDANGFDVLHVEEKKQFERLLRLNKADRINDRLSIVEAFLSSEEHLSAEQWKGYLDKSGVSLDLPFVENTLELMTKLGICERVDLEDSPALYEHKHLGEHHDHLICTKCGSITEFERPHLDKLKVKVAEEHGFHHLRHTLQIYGVCKKCMSERKATMPLALAGSGERLRVDRIAGGDKIAKHLMAMGITVGTMVEVISNSGGMVVIAVNNSRFVLGRDVSSRVHVAAEI